MNFLNNIITENDSIVKDEKTYKELIEIIKHYFGTGNVGSGIGELYEYNVSNVLKQCRYKGFPLEIDGSSNVKFGGKNVFSIGKKIGEIDALVCGYNDSWEELKMMCPYHIDRKPQDNIHKKHILAIEAKVSCSETITKMTKDNNINTSYWLFNTTETELLHNVLFVNGGSKSKEWVINGGSSNIFTEKLLWDALKTNNISIFYRESFSNEWVIDLTTRVDCLEDNEKTLIHRLNQQDIDITELKKKQEQDIIEMKQINIKQEQDIIEMKQINIKQEQDIIEMKKEITDLIKVINRL